MSRRWRAGSTYPPRRSCLWGVQRERVSTSTVQNHITTFVLCFLQLMRFLAESNPFIATNKPVKKKLSFAADSTNNLFSDS